MDQFKRLVHAFFCIKKLLNCIFIVVLTQCFIVPDTQSFYSLSYICPMRYAIMYLYDR